MGEAGAPYLQLGSFTEIFSLPAEWFRRLAEKAHDRGVRIKSVFSSHRELGGILSGDPALAEVSRANFLKLIEAGQAVGADYAGSSLGRPYADRMEEKESGFRETIEYFKFLSHIAREKGLRGLTMEPMSCLAEPPTLPEECAWAMSELDAYHSAHADTVPVYFCSDISHGYADAEKRVVYDNWFLFSEQIPHMCEFHFKNTDAIFNSTFGFGAEERVRGIVDLERLRHLIDANAERFPVEHVVGYLEIGGPKHGRDYSDPLLGPMLRESVAALREVFPFQP